MVLPIWGASIIYCTPLYPPLEIAIKNPAGFALYFAMMKWAVLGAAAVAQLKKNCRKSCFLCFLKGKEIDKGEKGKR